MFIYTYVCSFPLDPGSRAKSESDSMFGGVCKGVLYSSHIGHQKIRYLKSMSLPLKKSHYFVSNMILQTVNEVFESYRANMTIHWIRGQRGLHIRSATSSSKLSLQCVSKTCAGF